MKRLFFTVWVVSYLALSSQQSRASTKELVAAIFEVIPFSGDPYVSLETRQAYVNALLTYWNDFDSRVPRLSPSEDDWIKQELGAQGERLTRVINSREYAIFSLSADVDSCISSLRKLNAAYSDPAQAETEMFLWLEIVRCYTGIDSMMGNLQRAELSDGRFDGTYYTAGSSLIADVLLVRVIPSAMADTMGWTLSSDQ